MSRVLHGHRGLPSGGYCVLHATKFLNLVRWFLTVPGAYPDARSSSSYARPCGDTGSAVFGIPFLCALLTIVFYAWCAFYYLLFLGHLLGAVCELYSPEITRLPLRMLEMLPLFITTWSCGGTSAMGYCIPSWVGDEHDVVLLLFIRFVLSPKKKVRALKRVPLRFVVFSRLPVLLSICVCGF